EHPNGVRTHLSASAVAALPAARFRLLGLRGAYSKDGFDGQEEQLRAGMRPGDSGFGVELADTWGRISVDGQTRPHPTAAGRWVDFYPMLVEAIRNGKPPPVDARDAVAVIEVLESALAAIRGSSA